MNQNLSQLLCLAAVMMFSLLTIACTQNVAKTSSSHNMTQHQYPELADVYAKLKAGKHVTVAYLGGSITWGAQATDPLKTSYRALVTKHLEKKFPAAHVHAVDAAIGGTPSKLGVFRMDRDVLPYQPDLTFVEFAVNDTGAKADSQETMEGIIRKLRQSRPDMAVVVIIIGAGQNYGTPVRQLHLDLAKYYGLPHVDICGQVRAMIDAGTITVPDILQDGTHPNDRGYALYADIIGKEIDAAATAVGPAAIAPEKPLTQNRYERAAMLELAKLPDLGAWKTGQPSLVGTWFDHQPSRWLNSVVTAKQAGDMIKVQLKTDGVGLYYEIFKEGGAVEIKDGGKIVLTAKTDMTMSEHRLSWQFKILDPKQDRELQIICRDDKPVRLGYLLYLK